MFYGLPSLYELKAIERIGGLGVSLFFVLSGFLITHLLLTEAIRIGRISLGDFYLRRILRIWPLYFLVTLLGFAVIPNVGFMEIPGQLSKISDYEPKLWCFLSMSPHLATTFYNPPVPYAAVLWSVGVEEWFYVAWPLILIAPRWVILAVVPSLIVSLMLCRSTLTVGAPYYFFSQVRFDCMAVGALGALSWHWRGRGAVQIALTALLNSTVWKLVSAFAVVCLATGLSFGPFDELIYSSLFLTIIMNAACQGRGLRFLDSAFLRYVGKISYGIYCYNWITLVLALQFLRLFAPREVTLSHHLMHYAVALVFTFGVSAFSYRFIERPFLSLKETRFSPLHTA